MHRHSLLYGFTDAQMKALKQIRDAERPPGSTKGDEFDKVAFEPCGGDDLEDPRGLVAGVPERVPLAARLEDQVAGLETTTAR